MNISETPWELRTQVTRKGVRTSYNRHLSPMFNRLRNWLATNRARDQQGARAWSELSVLGSDGLSGFQREAERRILEVLVSHGITPSTREVGGNQERFILLALPSSEARVFIHLDGAEISGAGIDFRLERWDARTPDEHLDRFAIRLGEFVTQAS